MCLCAFLWRCGLAEECRLWASSTVAGRVRGGGLRAAARHLAVRTDWSCPSTDGVVLIKRNALCSICNDSVLRERAHTRLVTLCRYLNACSLPNPFEMASCTTLPTSVAASLPLNTAPSIDAKYF